MTEKSSSKTPSTLGHPAIWTHHLSQQVVDLIDSREYKEDPYKVVQEEANRAQLDIYAAIYGTRRPRGGPSGCSLADTGHVLRVVLALLLGLVAALAAAIPLNTCPAVLAVRADN